MLIESRFETPAGCLSVQHDETFIYQSQFIENPCEENATLSQGFLVRINSGPTSGFSKHIRKEIEAYFKNPSHRFQLQLSPLGTAFQKKVWNRLLVIPSGQVMTYGKLANSIDSSPRAIGQACKSNPLALFIPCHRVVGKSHLGGYMGCEHAITYKRALLKHEQGI